MGVFAALNSDKSLHGTASEIASQKGTRFQPATAPSHHIPQDLDNEMTYINRPMNVPVTGVATVYDGKFEGSDAINTPKSGFQDQVPTLSAILETGNTRSESPD